MKTTQPIKTTDQLGQIVNLLPVTVKTYKVGGAKVENEDQKIYFQQNVTKRMKFDDKKTNIESEAQLTAITKQVAIRI